MTKQDSIKELVGIINYALEDNTDSPVSIHDLAWGQRNKKERGSSHYPY